MTGGRQRRKRRLRKARQAAAAAAAVVTHISSLPEEIVQEIFLRLPSLATLVRAACACRAWRRAVASSPVFRSRFRALHPAPLLGVFTYTEFSGLPVFAAAHRRADPDVLAALRGGDFVLTSLLEDVADDEPIMDWRIVDCRDGYLLLPIVSLDMILLATVNPLLRQRPDYIDISSLDAVAAAEHRGNLVSYEAHMLSSDEDPMSFRLVWLFHDESRVRAAVFSSDTWDWTVLPWVEVAAPHGDENDGGEWLEPGTQANGLVCWRFKKQGRMLTLDTKTMEFSVWKLPSWSYPEAHDLWLSCSLVVGETKDGTLCLVCVTAFSIHVWMRRVDGNGRGGGADKWVLDDVLCYSEEPELLSDDVGAAPDVMAIRDGFVYLATSEMVLSLCLETWKLEKLFLRNFGDSFSPYFMAWPPSLIGNYGRFAVIQDKDDPSKDDLVQQA